MGALLARLPECDLRAALRALQLLADQSVSSASFKPVDALQTNAGFFAYNEDCGKSRQALQRMRRRGGHPLF